MNPASLIKNDLGEDVWRDCIPRTTAEGELPAVEVLSPFQSLKTYIVHGKTGQFEFATLPHGSYCIYVADGRRAIRLTRAGKEIESVLQENWSALPACDPVILANLILKFFDGGIRATHRVLRDADALDSYGKGYILNQREWERIRDSIGKTLLSRHEDAVIIRAITLCGWMHDKRNLGIEHIRVLQSGKVQLEGRETLSKKIFTSVPQIRY